MVGRDRVGFCALSIIGIGIVEIVKGGLFVASAPTTSATIKSLRRVVNSTFCKDLDQLPTAALHCALKPKRRFLFRVAEATRRFQSTSKKLPMYYVQLAVSACACSLGFSWLLIEEESREAEKPLHGAPAACRLHVSLMLFVSC